MASCPVERAAELVGGVGGIDRVLDVLALICEGLLIDAGMGEEGAGLARLGLAVTRGLLLDLLAIGDIAGTTRAFDLFTGLLDTWSGHDISRR